MNKNIVAIYCRLSKEDIDSKENESESIQNQKSILTSYSFSNDWDIYKIYSDEDYTGSDNNRPEWKQMLNDAQDGKFNIILCKSQSRFSRDMEIVEKYIHGKFLEWQIRFVSIVDNADTDVKGNKKSRQINGLINEWYLEDLSDNIKMVFKDKMERGEYIAVFPPYGYLKDTVQKNHLVIDPITSQIVKMIFSWHLEGYGAAKIARMLNDKGIPNPRKQQELNGLRKTKIYSNDENGIWITTTIGDILHNQIYCGDTVAHTKKKLSYKSTKSVKVPKDEWIIVENTHEAIIDKDIFNQVQGNLSFKRRASGTGEVHLLSGKVFCYYCKKPMQKNHGTSKNTKDIGYLRCRDKYSYSNEMKCPTPNIRIDEIIEDIKNELDSTIEEYFNKTDKSKIKFLEDKLNKKKSELYKKIKNSELEIKKYNKAIRNLYVDKINGIISEEQFKQFNIDFSENIIQCENTILKINNDIQQIIIECQKSKNIDNALDEYSKTRELNRNIINNIIIRIDYGDIDIETDKFAKNITWMWD